MELLALVLTQAQPAQPAPEGPSAAQQTAQWVLMAGGMAIIIWVMLRLQWKRQRLAAEEGGPVEAMRATIQDRQADAQRAAEVTDLVRDLAARLETRAARLEALLDQADEKIARLEAHEARLEEQSARLEDRIAAGGLARSMHERSAGNGLPLHRLEPDRARPAADDPADPWADDPAAEHAQREAGGDGARTAPAADPLHQEVYDLADAGEPPLAIARRLDQQVGTIELILALRR